MRHPSQYRSVSAFAPDQACAEAGQPLRLRRHAGYDHSYWFITSFIEDHLSHHGRALGLL